MTTATTKLQRRAEAVERLKNCVAARFDAESIVIALTSGRHGQSDWSLECDKLIDLLTDDSNDDSTPEKVVSGFEPCVTPESCRQYADQRKQVDDADCESCDSREKLEADAGELTADYAASGEVCDALHGGIIALLDRQEAITQHEITERWAEHLHPIERKCGDLRRKVEKLTAERDNLKANNEQLHTLVGEQAVKIDELQAQVDKLTAERQKPNPDCSAMLYKKFTENMKHEPCRDYEPKDDVSGYGADFNVVKPNFDNIKAVEMDASRFKAVEMDASRLVVREPDSREKLEDNVKEICWGENDNRYFAQKRYLSSYNIEVDEGNVTANHEGHVLMTVIMHLLDRQAAITAEETSNAWEEYRDATQLEIAKYEHDCELLFDEKRELTAERDKAREESVELYSDLVKASDEREHYREKCSKMATIIHDALMVMDEGMA